MGSKTESTDLAKKEPSLRAKIFLAMFTPWTSRKLWLAIVCIFVLISYFWTSVWYLYSFTTEAHIKTFESMFKQITWAIVVIIVSYILEVPTILNGFKKGGASKSTAESVQEIVKSEIPCEE